MIRLTVRVIPRSSRSGIAGIRDGALLVRLQSPPVEGAANEELIDILARTFGTGRRDISIESGTRSKLKRIAIERIDRREFELMLQSLGINPQELNPRHDRRETP